LDFKSSNQFKSKRSQVSFRLVPKQASLTLIFPCIHSLFAMQVMFLEKLLSKTIGGGKGGGKEGQAVNVTYYRPWQDSRAPSLLASHSTTVSVIRVESQRGDF
jgi:hypothetical protein